jgi:hypothetical protein
MPVNYAIPEGLSDAWDSARKKLYELIGNALDPRENSLPPAFGGLEGQRPTGLPGMIAGGIMPETPKDAYESGIIGMGPMPADIAANYRSPEMIQSLRKAMAAENRARGAINQSWDRSKTPMPTSEWERTWASEPNEYLSAVQGTDRGKTNLISSPDPVDQILRGSWFHGMRPEARAALTESIAGKPEQFGFLSNEQIEKLVPHVSKDFAGRGYPFNEDAALSVANAHGFPGSTHANPSYTRYGEPYGVSITASPSVAASGFSPDQMIHRVQPLYGGPPTEAIIPMWRPEGVKAMNEGYNTAFNQMLGQGVTIADLNKMQHLGIPTGYIQPGEPFLKALKGPFETASFMNQPLEEKVAKLGESMGSSQPITANFNTLYSKALQAQGKRGILYSPQRYGEYEMLMLDPSFVRPLDYRKATEYTGHSSRNLPVNNQYSGNLQALGITPGGFKGYTAAQPEFQSGTTRLSDVFNQVPWVDRISEENKRRMLELIDSQYREQVGNQLFNR